MGLFAVPDTLRPLGPYTQGKMGPQALPCPDVNRYSMTRIGLLRTMNGLLRKFGKTYKGERRRER
jgi:hypothetical protein